MHSNGRIGPGIIREEEGVSGEEIGIVEVRCDFVLAGSPVHFIVMRTNYILNSTDRAAGTLPIGFAQIVELLRTAGKVPGAQRFDEGGLAIRIFVAWEEEEREFAGRNPETRIHVELIATRIAYGIIGEVADRGGRDRNRARNHCDEPDA